MHSLPLTKLTNLSLNLKFVHEVCFISKTNKDKFAEIFPALLLNPTCNAESQKRRAKGSIKKTTGLCASRSYYTPFHKATRGGSNQRHSFVGDTNVFKV